jgi:hypothetical protein
MKSSSRFGVAGPGQGLVSLLSLLVLLIGILEHGGPVI